MTTARFFAYGSLVNIATHDHAPAVPARLNGWRRAWRHTELRPVAFLTVVPAPGAAIDGVLLTVPKSGLAALDRREAAYDRLDVSHAVPNCAGPAVSLYAIPEGRHAPPSDRNPILLSYLDVVVQGYHQVYGPDGVAQFFATTDGWNAPILNDRAAPVYPRHRMLQITERQLVDENLARLGAKLIDHLPD